MSQSYIIGSSLSSAIKIPDDREGVSGRHAQIIVDDDGKWLIEDMGSTNGTYVRDGSGEFRRVDKAEIRETDIIRLGKAGANSFVFTAHRILSPDDSYAYEFRQLRNALMEQRAAEAKKEKKIEMNGWISKLSGLGVILLCAIIGSFSGVNIDPNTRYILIACAPVAVGLFFSGDVKSLKALKKRREKILLCPKCNRPVSDFDIEEGQCSRCKAK